jgi:hypothetical protein
MSNESFPRDVDYSRRGLLAGAVGIGMAVTAATASQVSGASLTANGFQPGFDLSEALDVLQMCAYIYGGSPAPVKPPNWDVVFDSPQLPVFDNKWQLWKSSGGAYAIVIRGTVDTTGSVAEDLLSLLIKADDRITVGPLSFPYKFANEPDAAVHAGFALGALLVLKTPGVGVLDQLAKRRIPAGSMILIGGHSQGAAVATLVRSYLNYGADSPKNNFYKTYVFAQPKPGNDHYATDFENLFSNNGLAYRLTNSLDWVPQVPFTLEIRNDLNKPNPFVASTPLASTLNAYQAQVGQLLLQKEVPRLQKGASALRRTKVPRAPDTTNVTLPIIPSLNFGGAGTEVALIGKPCNPSVDQCDEWFQHHLTTYEALMKEQLKPTGARVV